MKKFFILILAIASLKVLGEDTFKVGLVLSPNLSWNRILPETYSNSTGEKLETSGNGLKLRSTIGFFLDRHIQDNFAFGTGLNYIFTGSGYEIESKLKNDYALQYVQVPLYIKFVSNEVADRLYIYAKGGVGPAVRTSAKLNGAKTYQTETGGAVLFARDDFRLFTIDAILSAGVEYELNGDTRLLAGITYNRGLTDVYKNKAVKSLVPAFQMYNDFISLDLGLKF